ncbi:transposase [Kribbella turkmenica]|uniref:Transposase n=1 Tax=Kribbella turkmenica TaxID=2530375 RepID=A0A4R4XGU1_9ACTN|nr:DDE-type integrase/transposase/recombinase [Kribbella turkmenica]TDD30015.1 transposase [Kribbella turkmenica]
MSKARLVITAITVEKRSVAEVVAEYGVARSWLYELLARYRTEGEAAFEPRSRRPKSSPRATPMETVELVLALRKRLAEQGLDAGADTIGSHLQHHHQVKLSRATIHRILTRHAAVTPDPGKRPRSSYLRFAADQPNECWQSDFTHSRLADAGEVDIISWLDDHSRLALHVTAPRRITGQIVVSTFRETVARYGIPASTLTDDGMVYTTRSSGGKGGRNGLETELRRLNITQKNSRPNHPTTCGKVGAVPADAEAVAARPARPAGHARRTSGPARRLRRRVQPASPAPVPAAPLHPGHRLHRPPKGHLDHRPDWRGPSPRRHRPRRPHRRGHPAVRCGSGR